MSHRNAPLTPVGRLRLVRRCRYRPIAHVAAEAGVSRQCLSKWVSRYRRFGETGLTDHSSTPLRRPTQLDADISDLEIGGAVRVSDLTLPEGVTTDLEDDEQIAIGSVTRAAMADEEEAAEAGEGEGAEGEAGEGEAPADDAGGE